MVTLVSVLCYCGMKAALFVLLILLSVPAHSQTWRVSRTGILLDGSLCSKNGCLWAGKDSLWISSDSGQSWKFSGFIVPNRGGDQIGSLAFHDRKNGVLLSRLGFLFTSSDGGHQWRRIDSVASSLGWSTQAICYSGTESDFVIASTKGLFSTSDAGHTWNKMLFANDVCAAQLQCNKLGSIWALTMEPFGDVQLRLSTNYGLSWEILPSPPKLINQFTLGSNSDSVLYATSKRVSWDSICKIYVSRDMANTWDT